MRHSDFTIGAEFTSDDCRWRCTDVGTRVVAAIRINEATIATKVADNPMTMRTISGAEAEAIGWYDGPPYGVVERLFDEGDQKGCEPA